MKFPERWHKWPEETPPEGEPLRIEIWNNLQNAYELGVGAVYEGEWCYYDVPAFKLRQPLFKETPPEIFWRLWEGRGMIKPTPLGQAIRSERLRCGTTLLDMARYLNMKPSELCAIEIGERPEPKDFVSDVCKFFFEKRKEMKNKVCWPRGFTRGVPTQEGTYVLLCRESGTYELIVREVHILNTETAKELDTTPGPNVLTLEEFWYEEPEFFGVVGYMKLDGVSAFDLWNHIGELEDEPNKEIKE